MAGKKGELRVGIITMPHERKIDSGTNHIMSSYVDWFMKRGVKVVAIPYDTPRPAWYFDRVDGVVIPGGGAKKNAVLYQTCLAFVRFSLEVWKKQRKVFPVWGTCLGFEIIVSLLGHIFPLQSFNALRYMAKLNWTSDTDNSVVFKGAGFTDAYMKQLSTSPLMEFNHSNGISPQKFRGNVVLHRVFAVTSVADDKDGRTFVASIEGRNGLPIYGVQGHPERQPVTNAPFLDFFVGELERGRRSRGRDLLALSGKRPAYVRGKCAQYSEHRGLDCFFFADVADGGKIGIEDVAGIS